MSHDQFSTARLGAVFQALRTRPPRPLQAPDSDTLSRLGSFWRLLLSWGEKINLTGARTLDDLLGDHLPDAAVLAAVLAHGVRVVDVGSGGGLPAVPLAILRPDLTLTLVEPRAKRLAFLRTCVREFSLRATVVDGRIEDAGLAGFDAACSRATFAPSEWVERGVSLVHSNGTVHVLHTQTQELSGLPAGYSVSDSLAYSLPGGQDRVWSSVTRST